ncbi:hypothetical protein SAMD00019534_101450 [Acytostelium subglobosum LB1]|uniref:hypothetical protein n=1 Tax=Acytostelium subglobosum LB1 TaxID=1410327 RepID=UPI000644D551|nr:hypothetical protein SAMD00019534_101450 [Acytostelium subglobosum LB1]GAM26970.1 hypothetical protein SAMD00019534_101450 [Acytostelium subglobosum LB1]|eukprot:XP_012750238.1 hypothetical protein SAMD00019534_101450 [Acytostelium subglobosum LB1]
MQHLLANVTFPNVTVVEMFSVQDSVAGITSKTFPAVQKVRLLGTSTNLELRDLSTLPPNLESLYFGYFNANITSFPVGLLELEMMSFDSAANFKLTKGLLPDTLRSLKLNKYKNPIEVGDLPDSLIEFSLSDNKYFPPEAVPPNLRTLRWANMSYHGLPIRPLLNRLPSSIKFMELSTLQGYVILVRLSETLFLHTCQQLHLSGFITMDRIIKHFTHQ